MRKQIMAVFSAAALLVSITAAVSRAQEAAPTSAEGTQEVARGTVSPLPASEAGRPSTVPDSVRAEAAARVAERREAADGANAGDGHDAAGEAGIEAAGRETAVATAPRESLSITRNFRNTQSRSVSSTLAEPAAALDGAEVFYSGNTYNSHSANHGSTWTAQPVHAGPAEANIPCCDPDVVHHAPLDTTFSLLLYVNSSGTNGVVDIEVRRGAANAVDCIFRIDPAGTANNIVPDYPHMGVTNGFVFLSTNNLQNGTSWVGANTRRFNASQMANCQATSFSSFNHVGSVGQRVHVPGEAQRGVTCQYWAQYESASKIRWFQWCDSAASPTTFTRSTTATTFANPDCRGGTGNFDFIERSTSWTITGFRGRTAVGGSQVTFLINAANDAAHPQAHLHGQTISRSSLGVVANLAVFNGETCFGYPALGSNSRDDLGLSLAVGGRRGGGGSAARGAVGVDDASSAGIFFPSVTITATGTHNRSDSRFGDYFTVRANDGCNGAWGATNYSLLNGNTSSSHVNARWVEFQSTSQAACP